MTLDRQKLKERIHGSIAPSTTRWESAEQSNAWSGGGSGTSRRPASGGIVVFPHAGVLDCGHQVAAAVHGCLDSGADRVIVISVLHAFTDEMEEARRRVSAGDDPSEWPFWGIQGPGIEGRDEWRGDHALISFRHFWAAETKRRGVRGPEVVERYPYLAGGHPERLPGIEELAALAEEAVIVSTADPFHHGLGYGDPPERALAPDDGGLELARATIEKGMALLGSGDYAGYDAHCVRPRATRAMQGSSFATSAENCTARSSIWRTPTPPRCTKRPSRPGSLLRSSSGGHAELHLRWGRRARCCATAPVVLWAAGCGELSRALAPARR